jgi:hypothetical protein
VTKNWAGHVTRTGEERIAYGGLLEKREGKSHLEDLKENGRIISEMIFKKWNGSMDVIDLFQDRDRWRALVKVIMIIRVT